MNSDEQPFRQMSSLLPWLTGLAVFVLVLAVTWGASRRDLSLDDRTHLAAFPAENQVRTAFAVLKLRHWQAQSLDATWRPPSKLLWWQMQRAGILVPPVLTFVTALLAGLCAAAFACVLARRERRSVVLPAIFAALPLLHPLAADVLLPFVGQADLMAALGVVAATALLSGRRRIQAVIAVILLAFAFVSKESAWPAAAAVPVFLWFSRESRPRRRRSALVALAASVVLLLAVLGVRYTLFGRIAYTTGGAGTATVTGERAVGIYETIGRYAAAFVLPRPPQTDYSFLKQPGTSAGFYPILGIITIAATVAGIFLPLCRTRASRQNAMQLRCRRTMVAAILWIILFLLPYIGIVPIGALWAGRFAFMSLFGFAMLLASVAALVHSRYCWVPVAVAVALLLAGVSGIAMRAGDWASPLRLWQSEVRREPTHAFAWKNLAAHLQAAGDVGGAYKAVCHATELWPTFGEAWLARGQIARTMNLPEDAEHAFVCAESLMPGDATVQVEQAKLLASRRRFPEAAERLQKVLQRDPANAEAARVLDRVLAEPQTSR
jgi:Flp pilus assembly protein TadD